MTSYGLAAPLPQASLAERHTPKEHDSSLQAEACTVPWRPEPPPAFPRMLEQMMSELGRPPDEAPRPSPRMPPRRDSGAKQQPRWPCLQKLAALKQSDLKGYESLEHLLKAGPETFPEGISEAPGSARAAQRRRLRPIGASGRTASASPSTRRRQVTKRQAPVVAPVQRRVSPHYDDEDDESIEEPSQAPSDLLEGYHLPVAPRCRSPLQPGVYKGHGRHLDSCGGTSLKHQQLTAQEPVRPGPPADDSSDDDAPPQIKKRTEPLSVLFKRGRVNMDALKGMRPKEPPAQQSRAPEATQQLAFQLSLSPEDKAIEEAVNEHRRIYKRWRTKVVQTAQNLQLEVHRFRDPDPDPDSD